jgi:hypothetical protein
MTSFSDKSCTENQNTHFMFNKVFPKIVQFMMLMWKNMVHQTGHKRQYNSGHAHCMWIAKATDTLLEYAIFIAFQCQQRLCERA